MGFVSNLLSTFSYGEVSGLTIRIRHALDELPLTMWPVRCVASRISDVKVRHGLSTTAGQEIIRIRSTVRSPYERVVVCICHKLKLSSHWACTKIRSPS